MLRLAANLYHICTTRSNKIAIACDVCLFDVCFLASAMAHWAEASRGAGGKNLCFATGRAVPRKFCEKMKSTYPSTRACKFLGKIAEFQWLLCQA
jgi:hypothetical protein